MIEMTVVSLLLAGMIGGGVVAVGRILRRGEVRRMRAPSLLLLALVTSGLAYALWGFYAAILKHGWAEVFIRLEAQAWRDGQFVEDAVDQALAQEWQAHGDGLRREIWVQMVIPGEGQRPCYTQDRAACALLEQMRFYAPPAAQDRRLLLALSLAAGAACGATAWLLAGRKRRGRQAGEGKAGREAAGPGRGVRPY